MYPEELSSSSSSNNNNNNNSDIINVNNGGRRGNLNALRPPPPYSRPPPYARPPPPYSRPSSEELLFDDVFREKAVALRSVMTDFLLVQPFHKFDTEFQSFLTRVKRLTAEGQRAVAAAAAIRDANAAAAVLAATAAANNLTVDAACAVVAAASGSERPPPPPYVYGLAGANSHGQGPSVDQPGTSASAGPSTNRVSLVALNFHGDVANNGSSSRAIGPTNPTQSGSSSMKINEKYLSKWSVDVMTLDLACSVAVMKLSGTLLAEDKVTILEETHDAGMIESRKGKNSIKTIDGLYHLIGPINSGFSNDFYHACLVKSGFPKNWRKFLILLANVEETNDDEASNSDSSMTRNGTNYRNGSPKSNEKKLTKQTLAKQKVVMQQLSQASTNKTIEQFTSCKTPSQFLKYQFHRKLVKACKIVTNQFK